MTIPFVKLYTHGVTDTNYIYGPLPIMFCLIQLISWSRYVGGQLTGIAGYAKQTSYVSLIEVVINLSCSILFVHKFGIVGVALPIKVIWCTYIADKKVMKRSYWKSISIMGINYIFFFSIVLLSRFFQLQIQTYWQFLIWGVILSAIFGIIGMEQNFLVNKEFWGVTKRVILKKG